MNIVFFFFFFGTIHNLISNLYHSHKGNQHTNIHIQKTYSPNMGRSNNISLNSCVIFVVSKNSVGGTDTQKKVIIKL